MHALVVALMLLPPPFQVPVPRNPTLIEFDCPDHAQDTGHELEVRLRGTATPGTVFQLGDPAPRADGKVEVDISKQVGTLSLANYELFVRAVGPGGASDNSAVVPFDRVARRPTNLIVR